MKLTPQFVLINAAPKDKHEAITTLAQTLANAGKIQSDYIQGFIEREKIENTYLGKGIAIPHGVPESRHLINETAIAVMQIPDGIVWGKDGEKAYLAVGIAAQGDEHIQVLRKLTRLFGNQETLDTLFATDNAIIICNALNDEQMAIAEPNSATDELQTQSFAYHKTIVLPNPQGMHARPASRLQKFVSALDATVVLKTAHGKVVDASKMFDVLGLGLTHGSEITVQSDNEQAMNQVVAAINLGLGDDLTVTVAPTQKAVQHTWQPTGDIKTIKGVAASDGLVIGKIYHYGQAHYDIPTTSASPLEESIALDAALQKALQGLYNLINTDNVGSEEVAILESHVSILNDTDVIKEAATHIHQGQNAAQAYKAVTDERIQTLSAVADTHIAARASDIRDVQKHVMSALLNISESGIDSHVEPMILCAEDLTPSDTMKLSPDNILGFITELGGPTGHSAIIARNMGLPAIVATGGALKDIADGTEVIMDGTSGIVYLEPTDEQRVSAQQAQQVLLHKKEESLAYRQKKGQTKDGHLVEICANTNEAEDVAHALECGAEGVGLMRTEMLYLSSKSIPTEEFQYKKYLVMAQALGDKPLIIRTLDIGGDKEVDYLGLDHEDNSFLGMRGIRLCFERPDLFIPQLRAICRVAKECSNIHVMFPMIGKLSDWYRAKEILEEVREQIGAPKFPVGIMIEIPSAALIAPQFAKYVDFFSIGTNDLTQYTLAMDRMHPILASQTDAMHPAVLRLIDMTVQAAHKHGKWVGVCGNAGGDIQAIKVLVGLGVDELSMSPSQIASAKQILDQYTFTDLQTLAQEVLIQESSASVREILANS